MVTLKNMQIEIINNYSILKTLMRGSRKFCQRGSNFGNVFLLFFVCLFFFFSLMKGGRIQIPLLASHQRPANETPFKWRFAGGPMMAQYGMGLVAL